MAYLELNEIDRKRYGIPDRVEFEYGQFGLRAVKALKTQTGMTLEYVEHAVFTGKPAADGSDKVERDEDAMAALVWLILYCAGHRIPWDDFDVLPTGLKLIVADEDGEEEEAGKEPTETDGSSTPTTT